MKAEYTVSKMPYQITARGRHAQEGSLSLLLRTSWGTIRLLVCAYPKLTARPPTCRRLPLYLAPLSAGLAGSSDFALSGLAVDFDKGDEDPRPPSAHPTSMPHLILHNHARTKTGVLIRTFRTGKRSGYREGGETRNSRECKLIAAA